MGNSKKFENDVVDSINEAFRHYKLIGITTTGKQLFASSKAVAGPGIIVAGEAKDFNEDYIAAVSAHRHWNREIVK